MNLIVHHVLKNIDPANIFIMILYNKREINTLLIMNLVSFSCCNDASDPDTSSAVSASSHHNIKFRVINVYGLSLNSLRNLSISEHFDVN